ncbi:hypothetical protein SAMN05216412_10867 [Nitrosospira multiformis]|uniref:Uncharacterized protein n=1 Tax=Nitrosospira multiformis TaxID=1231 RepID=A0A1I0FC07_9PROT|nr:hypothetical protein SAMN05216412_10867 [Nitrosospira multiformis]
MKSVRRLTRIRGFALAQGEVNNYVVQQKIARLQKGGN